MKTFSLFVLIAALGLGLLVANVWAAESMAQGWSKEYSFNQIVGMSVKNQQGEDLGKIHDIVVDSQGHVPFAVLSRGILWGMGGKLVAVPFSALAFDKMDKYLVLDISKDELDSAPSFNVRNLASQKWVEGVYRYFGQQPYWMEEGRASKEAPMKESKEDYQEMTP